MAGPFELLDDVDVGIDGDGNLDERERRLVIGSANYYSFVYPGRTIRLTVVRGPANSYPSLTADHCRHIGWLPDRNAVATLIVRSAVPGASDPAPGGVMDLVIDIGGGAEPIDKWAQLDGPLGTVRRAARFLRPIEYDFLRQTRTDVEERRSKSKPLPRRRPVDLTRPIAAPTTGSVPAVLFGLHWLELGGAERWALDCIQLAKDAGLVPIVVTDRASPHPWITRPEFDGAVIVPMTHPITLGHDGAFLSGVFAAYDVRGIHVHHNTWLYDRLPWIKSVRPDVPVVDSLHILEWRTGGFVDHAVCMSDLIDEHHVISPALRDYLTGKHGISSAKVTLATLANLTTESLPRSVSAGERRASGSFTVCYVGRFHQQKRPYLFLKLATELHKATAGRMRFVMHGDGELAGEVQALRTRYGLSGVLDLRGPDRPVRATLAESDVLVITSENEGLSLTSFEATAAGIPVVSTDVGSQASIVADDLLCPRHPYKFVAAAASRIREMADSPAQYKGWFDEQAAKAGALKQLPHAKAWAQKTYRDWGRS
ncbi:MAG TPA: glycosyltransferase [Amycolatopsis sp.]|uniref:glycosyltransferase n=1 Tax=Amycolatopsis sp. TaxID=37632 RepID=UPI002B4986C9|nr:glycosyltransferase [Amycolatopsis sp.]HKS48161.1 glycosyltransferase [Amycolatopsis sp.]